MYKLPQMLSMFSSLAKTWGETMELEQSVSHWEGMGSGPFKK